MSGFKKLNYDVRREMLEDARDFRRGQVFRAAQQKSEIRDLDEYIKLLSESMEYVLPYPTKRVTRDFRL